MPVSPQTNEDVERLRQEVRRRFAELDKRLDALSVVETAYPATLDVVYDDNEIINDASEVLLYAYPLKRDAVGQGHGLRLALSGTFLNSTGAGATFNLRIVLGNTTLYEDTSASFASLATEHPWSLSIDLLRKTRETVHMLGDMQVCTDPAAPATGLGDLTSSTEVKLPPLMTNGDAACDWSKHQQLQIYITLSSASNNLIYTLRSGRLEVY